MSANKVIFYENENTILYLDEQQEQNESVLIKTTKQSIVDENQSVRFNNEYQNIKNLNLSGIRRAIKVGEYRNKPAIWLEFVDAQTFKSYFSEFEFDLQNFLTIAINICQTLGKIHECQLIHKDLSGSNILVNPDTLQTTIIDFDISSKIDLKTLHLGNPERLEGTLTHISPEQTGRMNRVVDYRTDFYSLGVTFYQVLAGKLPFQTDDPMELIHAHIAKHPVAIHKMNPQIPFMLSEIVYKLLEKNAEDRYKSAYGIKYDLEKCQARLQDGKIKLFLLGRRDYSGSLQIPSKLYGREEQHKRLLKIFDRVSQGHKEFAFISGYSGVGKSAFVNKIHKPITEKRGWYISGKFDQFQRDTPYYSVILAFKELVHLLLLESEASIAYWKDKINTALGNVGQVLLDVLPEIEQVIGPQPKVPDLSGEEAKNRFHYVLRNFIKSLADKDHPLVIFIDDLQWADSGSLALIKALLTDNSIQYLFFIGACRSNEVSPAHSTMITLQELTQKGVDIHEFVLENLKTKDILNLLKDTLRCPNKEAHELAGLIRSKTRGNAFFVNQFLHTIYEKELLKFNFNTNKWEWNTEQLKKEEITDNVVELLAQKIKKLPHETQEVLKVCSCIGSRFKLQSVANIIRKDEPAALDDLWAAMSHELILPLSEDYKYIRFGKLKGAQLELCFVHDRIQQAVYTLISDKDRKELHRHVGNLFINKVYKDRIEEHIFDIIYQFQKCIDLIEDEVELIKLSKLFLIAGDKALASAAYQPALYYYEQGKACISSDHWTTNYDLYLKLITGTMHAAYMSKQYDKMLEVESNALKHIRVGVEKKPFYLVKIQYFIGLNQLKEAVQCGLEILEELHVNFPKNPGNVNILMAIAKVKMKLLGKKSEHILNKPKMTDKEAIAAMEILSRLVSASYQASPKLLPLIIIKQIDLSLKFGNTEASAFAYLTYGFILCGVLNSIDEGYRYGQLGLSIYKKLDAKKIEAEAKVIFNGFIRHWKEPLIESVPEFKNSYRSGLETGNLEYSSISLLMYCHHNFLSGKSLVLLSKEIETYSKVIKEANQESTWQLFNNYNQFVSNLTNVAVVPGSFYGHHMSKEVDIVLLKKSNHGTALYFHYSLCGLQYYLFHQIDLAEESVCQMQAYVESVVSAYSHAYGIFIETIVYIAAEPRKYKRKINKNLQRYRNWLKYSPENFKNKYYLMLALWQAAIQKTAKARENFDLAIKYAKESANLFEEALAKECAAKFYLQSDLPNVAQYYIQDAYKCYKQWGAHAKIAHIEKVYAELIIRVQLNRIANLSVSTTVTTTSYSGSQILDLNSIIRASQTLSGEVILAKLLETLMQIIIQNAGAERGLLLLNRDEKWFIEAEGHIENSKVDVLQSVHLENASHVSLQIVRYVIRTKKELVIKDAFRDEHFKNDSYVLQRKPKSILCMPLMHKGSLSGVLYLENNLSTGAFTEERLEILNLLTSQVAISIENALLYENLEQKVKVRTEEVVQQKQQLEMQNEELVALNNEKNSLIHIVAHDLKSPLNHIDGLIQIIKLTAQNSLDEEQLKSIERIMQSTSRLRNMINQILDVDAIESKKTNIKLEQIDITNICQNLADDYVQSAVKKDIQLVHQFTPSLFVKADNTLLTQSIENLISNAIKFSPAGRSIYITTQRKDGKARVIIKDEGPGLTEQDMSKLFGKFQKLSARPTGGEHSTGLGLSIVKKYINEMNGKVWCESEFGNGASFIIEMNLISNNE